MAATNTKLSLDDLRSVVGEENAREAAEEDAVDGVRPAFVAEPGTVEETGELLRLLSERGAAVIPRGGGTKMGWGNPPRALDVIVSTARMNGIIEHVPGDQVVRAQAGLKLSGLQKTLQEHDQMLALDPPGREGATVGGVVAANASGPRRYRYGTVRDLIIGITVVLSDGTVAKAGGKVVKNVAGYDLGKLFTGSHGTLGVIASANFRLHPLPAAARTVAVELLSPQDALGVARAVMHSQLVPSAVELRWSEGAKLLTVLIEGIRPGVEAQSETAAFLLKDFGEVRTLTDEEAGALGPLEPAERTCSADEVSIKVSAPPAELAGVLESVTGAVERRGVGVEITGHAETGVTYARLSGGSESEKAELVEEIREIWVRRGGSVVVRGASPEFKRRVGVWGYGGDALGLMRRIKEKFDPPGIMSPGRFVGGI